MHCKQIFSQLLSPVAIKKIKTGAFKDGIDISAIREIKFLRELSHPNVIALLGTYSKAQSLSLVLEYLDTDLEAVIKDKTLVFKTADVKSWMAMSLRGLHFCHTRGVLHRDLKPNNLLISSRGELKIADFGLAREVGDVDSRMTCQVVTRWYRSPELLWGARSYSYGVDMWSIGTIFIELILRKPFLPGETDMDQLKKIITVLGTPTEEEWPGHKTLPDYVNIGEESRGQRWTPWIMSVGKTGVELIKEMLRYDPLTRVTAKAALYHKFFTDEPRPTPPVDLPKPTAELVPRSIAPEEVQGKPMLKSAGGGMKRQAESPEDGLSFDGTKRVARRLF